MRPTIVMYIDAYNSVMCIDAYSIMMCIDANRESPRGLPHALREGVKPGKFMKHTAGAA